MSVRAADRGIDRCGGCGAWQYLDQLCGTCAIMAMPPTVPLCPGCGRPVAVDTYCCEGGVSIGLARAGFCVVGVDLFKHTNAKGKRVGFSRARYPFPAWQGSALDALDALAAGQALQLTAPTRVLPGPRCEGTFPLRAESVALYWGSPPCQRHSAGTRARDRSDYPDLIGPTRERFKATGRPYVIENVPEAPLHDPLLLCGSMFGLVAADEDGHPLALERHRKFESNLPLTAPAPCQHDPQRWPAGTYGGARGRRPGQTAAEHRHEARYVRHGGYVPKSLDVRRALLGIDHMTAGGMAQAIPPAYTEHLGRQIMRALYA